MNKEDIKIDGVYLLKRTSGLLVRVKVLDIVRIDGHRGGFYGRTVTRYKCLSLKTGREIIVKSAVKFRYLPEGD